MNLFQIFFFFLIFHFLDSTAAVSLSAPRHTRYVRSELSIPKQPEPNSVVYICS